MTGAGLIRAEQEVFLLEGDIFLEVQGTDDGTKLCLGGMLDGLGNGYVMDGVGELSVGLQGVLLSVHYDHLGAFISRFDDDVRVIDEFCEGPALDPRQIVSDCCGGSI